VNGSRVDGLHPVELALGVVAVGAMMASGFLWLAASIGALLSAGHWPELQLVDALEALTRLPRHLGSPREAWPREARAELPGAVLMYAVGGLLIAGVGGAVWFAIARGLGGLDAPRGARWASTRQLGRLLARRPQPGRVTLGRRGRRLVCCERLHSTLVIGPTQTGKTTGLAVPAILEWDGPVLATSVKTDLLRDTIDARAERGNVQLFDPVGTTGLPSSSWTPLASCETWAGARRTAGWLAEGASASKRGLTDGDFWYAAAAKLLAPLLFAAARSRHTMADVVTWVDTQEEVRVQEALLGTRERAAINAFDASIARDERQRSSIYTTAETVLEAYADPDVLARSRTAGIRGEELLDGGSHTLYLSATVREQRRLRPVFVALIESVIEEAYRRSAETGRPLDPPLLVVLDEAANIAPLPDIDVIASTGAGHGVQLVTVLQDLAQAHDRWGRDRADTIVNNHRARVIAGGTADQRTLEYVGRMLGDTEVRRESSTTGEPGRRSTTVSSGFRPLAPANVVRERGAGSALLLYGALPPAWIKFRPWFRDRALSRMARSSRST
jgi:type IV secretion system protein VirD4